MVRLAEINDLEKIMPIITAIIQEMRMAGNDQWNEDYPQIIDFKEDIDNQELYVSERDRQITGFICINPLQPVEYQNVNWSVNEKPLVLHRMAVNPAYRNQGIGSELMRFAEELALSKEIRYLRSDTYSLNPKMNALFQKMDYRLTGEIYFSGRTNPFNCYEKMLV
jgi:GNAT superfamily N-acetyltransferase